MALSPSESPRQRYHIVAVERALSVLGAFEQSAEWRLVDIARATGLTETTALRYLSTLVEHQMVERDEEGVYRLGMRLFQLGQRALGQPDVRHIAFPQMEALLDRFEETVNLAVQSRDHVVIIDVLESRQSIRKGATVGETDQWHSSGLGKAILAGLPEAETVTLLEHQGLPQHTPHTLSSIQAILEQLAEVRSRGYAIDDEEGEPGLRCVAAAVRDRRGHTKYAISVSGPAQRLRSEIIPEIGEAVVVAAGHVSRALGDRVPAAPYVVQSPLGTGGD